jgi:hypothetical protein
MKNSNGLKVNTKNKKQFYSKVLDTNAYINGPRFSNSEIFRGS